METCTQAASWCAACEVPRVSFQCIAGIEHSDASGQRTHRPARPPHPTSLHPQVTPSSSKVIDPEFAYMGPLAFDPAMIIGELTIPYFAADGHEAAAGADGSRAVQRVWLLEAIVEVWDTFSKQ